MQFCSFSIYVKHRFFGYSIVYVYHDKVLLFARMYRFLTVIVYAWLPKLFLSSYILRYFARFSTVSAHTVQVFVDLFTLT